MLVRKKEFCDNSRKAGKLEGVNSFNKEKSKAYLLTLPHLPLHSPTAVAFRPLPGFNLRQCRRNSKVLKLFIQFCLTISNIMVVEIGMCV